MKITELTLTLFSWESIPSTSYGHHTARPTGKSDLGLLRIMTDEGIEGHAFLGTSSNPASLDGPALMRRYQGLRGGAQSSRRRLHGHARFDLELPLRGGSPGRPRHRGDELLLVRGPARRPGHLQLRQVEAEARHPDPRHRIPDRRPRFIYPVDHRARHRLSPR